VTGLNPIKEPKPAPERSLNLNIKQAVSMVASAMREGMLDPDDVLMLEQGGIHRTQVKQSVYETYEDLLATAQETLAEVRSNKVMIRESPAEFSRIVGLVVKLMDSVRKSQSEARRVEELTALESALHGCISDIQDEVSGNKDLEVLVDSAVKTMMRNLEDNLKNIQAKYED